ncbi:hypothetical protein OG897_13510 [Streptomyces sp. NBC_00237]|uniref:hypothetical protein n=1 Tax=Streptomyces sp. NBC_00237 TaxID=2975687 RepID=UPI0022544E90|nr:hypothetical protein [Streptomyces sp. NBC_00237]MCX5202461.1 hypothetical protein [Streptomyces sp. NBC_00237]
MRAHRYEYTAANGLEAKNLLNAALDLLDAHMKLLAPGAKFVHSDLLEDTPVRLTLALDLAEASEISVLNQAMRADG